MAEIPIDAIAIGPRVRRDMGDIEALAASIKELGLLHPVVVRSDHTLVAGERRLRAVQLLGWTEVPVTVVDVDDMLQAESDENRSRKDFTPSEMYELGKMLEPAVRERAKQRQREAGQTTGRGMPSIASETVTEPIPPNETREVVGRAVGVSGPTYQRIKALGQAAEEDPETYGDLMTDVEAGRKSIAGAHDELSARKAGENSRCKTKQAVPKKQSAEKRAAQIAELTAKGYAPRQIAETLAIGEQQVRNIAKAHGIALVTFLDRTRRIDSDRIVNEAANTLEALVTALDLVEVDKLDPEQIEHWATSLSNSLRSLNRLAKQLKEIAQ